MGDRRPDARPDPREVAAATLVLVLAGVVAWRAIGALTDADAAAVTFRLGAWIPPAWAHGVVIAAGVVALAAAALLAWRPTRAAGGWLVAAIGAALALHMTVAWVLHRPVECLCGPTAAPRSDLVRGLSIVAVAAVGLLGGIVGAAGRRPAVPTARDPRRPGRHRYRRWSLRGGGDR